MPRPRATYVPFAPEEALHIRLALGMRRSATCPRCGSEIHPGPVTPWGDGVDGVRSLHCHTCRRTVMVRASVVSGQFDSP